MRCARFALPVLMGVALTSGWAALANAQIVAVPPAAAPSTAPRAAAPPASFDDVGRELNRLSMRLDTLATQMVTTQALAATTSGLVTQRELQDRVDQLNRELARVRDDVEQLKQLYRDQSAQIGKLHGDFSTVTDTMRQQVVEQRQLLEAVAGKDTSGAPYLKMLSAMQSDQGRSEVQQAVNQSLRREGTLRVENRMATAQTLAVNDTRYEIGANTTRDFTVPVGTVTTELVGFEAAKHLTVAAPMYLQRLVIAPAATTQVARRVVAPMPGVAQAPPLRAVEYSTAMPIEIVDTTGLVW